MSDLKKVTEEDSGGFLVDYVAAALRELPDELRLEVMAKFCRGCGREDPTCQCENDE